MAKQIAGICFLEGTIDDLTFYKMDGQHYCRAKSCLTSERVKTSPRFKLTMMSARRLARASKIGAVIYKALPPRWRQFWMYRAFTGEAFSLLKETLLTEKEITAQLYACYVAYWDTRKAADPEHEFWQPVPVKIRKRRKYSAESLKRRWDAMQVKRPRKEIREEKRREAEELRAAWKEKLALRDAARAAAKAAPKRDTRRKRHSARRLQWHIDLCGILQKRSVPAVTRRRPTGTQTIFCKRDHSTLCTVPCNSS